MDNKSSSKNISTLIVGSLLIMMSLIFFLITSWHSMTNSIKLIIMVLFEVFFLGLSILLKGKYKLDKLGDVLYYIGITYIPILLFLISFFSLFGDYLSLYGDGKYIYLTIASLVSAFIYYIVGNKNNKDVLLYFSILFQILSLIFYAYFYELESIVLNVILLTYNLLLLLNSKKNINTIGISILIVLIYRVFACYDFESIHHSISWLLILLNFIAINSKNKNMVYSILINISIFKIGHSLIFFNQINNFDIMQCQIFSIIYSIIVILLINLFNKDEKILKSSRIVTLIYMSILYYYFIRISELPLYMFDLLIGALLFLYYNKTKNNVYKGLLYFISIIFLINICNEFYGNRYLLASIPAIYTSGLLLINIINNKENKKSNYIIYTILSSLSLLIIMEAHIFITSIIAMILSLITIIYNRKNNKNHYLDLIPLLLLTECIKNDNIHTSLLLFSIPAIGTTIYNYFENETYSYSISSFVFLYYIGLSLASYLEINIIFYLIMILWSFINVSTATKENAKNIFKCFLVLFLTIMYYDIAKYLMINDYTIIKISGVYIAGLYIIKEIIAKLKNVTKKDINIIEYFLFSIVYFIALSFYVSAYDGLVFTFALLIITLVGYEIKDEAMFTVSLISLLINALYLTREFWLEIPWWIYLLIIGGILILTAVVNEIDQNNGDKKSINNTFDTIKKHFNK